MYPSTVIRLWEAYFLMDGVLGMMGVSKGRGGRKGEWEAGDIGEMRWSLGSRRRKKGEGKERRRDVRILVERKGDGEREGGAKGARRIPALSSG